MDKAKLIYNNHIKPFLLALWAYIFQGIISLVVPLAIFLDGFKEEYSPIHPMIFYVMKWMLLFGILSLPFVWVYRLFHNENEHIIPNMTPDQNEKNFLKDSIISGVKWGGVIILAFIAMNVVLWGTGTQPTPQANQEVLQKIMIDHMSLFLPLAVLIAPLLEEMTFRHYLTKAFNYHYIGYIISACLFILVHAPSGLSGILLYGTISVVLTTAHYRSRNIITTITAHITYNAMTVLVMLAQLYFSNH